MTAVITLGHPAVHCVVGMSLFLLIPLITCYDMLCWFQVLVYVHEDILGFFLSHQMIYDKTAVCCLIIKLF